MTYREKRVKEFYPFIVSISLKLIRYCEDESFELDDFIQEGLLILLELFNKVGMNKPNKYYIVSIVRGLLLAPRQGGIKVPPKVLKEIEDGKYN